MAIYRFETKNIGRANNPLGRSVVAAAAYRAGEKLRDNRYETSHDYSRRTEGIVHAEILTPDTAPAFADDRESLWNAVEKSEKRKDARLAREFVISLPHELTPDERRDLLVTFANDELVSRGMIVDLTIHEPKKGLNHHAHLLCTTRTVDASGFGLKEREWNEEKSLEGWREAWETHCNSALEKAGLDARVDRHSLEDRGIERTPEPKLGAFAAALERQGIESERGKAVREVHYENSMLAAIRDVVTHGEVTEFQQFDGQSWWERMLDSTIELAGSVVDRAMNTLGALLKDESGVGMSWADREMSRRESRDAGGPELEPG